MSWEGWEPRERAVLVFVRDGEEILLIRKKRGLGTGKINGPGGRLEPGETWAEAGIRETREETGLTPRELEPAAWLRFQFTDGYSLEVRAFLGRGWAGTLASCDEADPFWHPVAALPWGQMWADDALWLPPVLGGRKVSGRFLFDGNRMQEAWIEEHREFPSPFNG